MATKTFSLLAVVVIAVMATISTVAARPCKTLFYFSTTAYYPIVSNPNSPNPRYYALIFTTTRRFPNPQPNNYLLTSSDSEPDLSLKLSSYSTVSSSIKDRTKDIMSVVGALLFGIGCGALTAAIMYFLWALCSPRSFEDVLASSDDDDDDDDDDDYDDVAAIKKKLEGYVAITVKQVADDDDAKEEL